jgi:hypothetical protein
MSANDFNVRKFEKDPISYCLSNGSTDPHGKNLHKFDYFSSN